MIGRRKSAIETVEELLKDQKAALLEGDLSALGKIEAPLERALQMLKSENAERADLERVQIAAGRNANLLAAAQRGIAMARSQVAKRGPDGLSTYDAQGHSHTTMSGTPNFHARR